MITFKDIIKAGSGTSASCVCDDDSASLRFYLANYTAHYGTDASCMGVPDDLTLELKSRWSDGTTGNQTVTSTYGLVYPADPVLAVPNWRNTSGDTPLVFNGARWNTSDPLPFKSDIIDDGYIKIVKITPALEIPTDAAYILQDDALRIKSVQSGEPPTIDDYEIIPAGTRLPVSFVLDDAHNFYFHDNQNGSFSFIASPRITSTRNFVIAPGNNILYTTRTNRKETTRTINQVQFVGFSLRT